MGLMINVGVILFASLMGVCMAISTQHIVGDTKGWALKVDYNAWTAATKEFYPEDILVFMYDEKAHNVVKVNQNDYNTCNSKAPLATYATGKDQILLDKPGDYYFICGVPGHCQDGGMKVTVNVVNGGQPGQHYQDYN